MPQEILDLLARLREPGENPLTDAELTTLLDGLRKHAEELRDAERTDEVVTQLQETAAAVKDVRAEQSTRADAAAERDRQAEEALAEITAGDGEGDGEGEGADGTDAAGGDGTDAAAGGEGDGAGAGGQGDGDAAGTGDGDAAGADAAGADAAAADAQPQPIAAAARPGLGTVQRSAPAPRRPAPAVPRATATLTAAGDLPGYSAGSDIDSIKALGAAMAKRLRSMGRQGGSVLVASLTTEYPEERTLRLGETEANDEKISAVVDNPTALTAAGGICAPVAVDYSIPTFASIERPVRDALVRFGAERGGVTFTPPPVIADVAGATSIWTEATDAAPAGATKAVIDVDCGDPVTVLVDAIVTRLRFGNMQGRFSPEGVAANTQNALAAAARVAEVNLLNKLHTASTEVTLAPSVGAGRGILEILDLIIAAVRYRMRLSDQARFRAIPPAWLRDMIRSDFTRELANDADRIGLADAQIAEFFTARGVNVSWALDGVAAQGTGNTYPQQGFADQAPGALASYPAKVAFPMFPEGSFQFLDGGELNLGVVRDVSLNEVNKYETFIETFENVAFRGVESAWAIATVAPTGASAGTVVPAFP
jgi:hypothetical protein